jgi:ABC-type glycerol-3-phosphate transport system permease component
MKHARSLEVLRIALLALGLVLIGVPFLWILLTAFKRPVDAAAVPPKFLSPVTLMNFTTPA